MIRFTLNGEAVAVDGIAPTTTVLDWLRNERGLCGTKEGCAEGDCGACSVLVDDNGTLRAIDSCLVWVPMLSGRRVITVEGLGTAAHPHVVQTALADRLGSQCGYCTPGFAVSLAEAAHRHDLRDAAGSVDAARLADQLCGNLCRCTGYRPIREAAELVAGTHPPDGLVGAGSNSYPCAVRVGGQEYDAPATEAHLYELLADHPDARIVAGCTDLALDVSKRGRPADRVISLEAIGSLRGITPIEGGHRIGATTLLSDLESWADGPQPSLARMLRYFASRQIKNRATLGGNLCNASPIGDTPPVVLALGATMVVRSAQGERRVPVDEFFLGYRKTALQPGEILAAVDLPDPPSDALCASYKVSKRRELDISSVCASYNVRIGTDGRVTHARLAYGGMAAVPARAKAAEAALIGRPFDEPSVEAAMDALAGDFKPIDDLRGSAWYRATVARNLLLGFWLETRDGSVPRLPDWHAATIVEAS